MSQPARACVIFCRINSIQVEEKLVHVTRGGTRTKEFRKVNPLGKIPSLKEGNFVLNESASIMRYLATKHHTPDNWYPGDPIRCAKVNSALDWYHGNVRLPAIMLTWYVVAETMNPPFKPFSMNDRQAQRQLTALQGTLQTIEEYWLGSTGFLAGSEISIADLLYSCELDQMRMLDSTNKMPTYEELLQPYPKVQQWMGRVAEATHPHWQNVTALMHRVAQRGKAQKLNTAQSKL